MDELLDTPAHYASIPEFAEVATHETVDMVINAGAQFCEEVLSPFIS